MSYWGNHAAIVDFFRKRVGYCDLISPFAESVNLTAVLVLANVPRSDSFLHGYFLRVQHFVPTTYEYS